MTSPKFILTDIEGTTSDISFVKDTLFPYASKHLPQYIRDFQHELNISKQLDLVAQEANCARENIDHIIEVLLEWIRQDLKKTPLKELQGFIWAYGYKQEHFKGHLYFDAFQQLSFWHQKGIPLGVYSSGSVNAQKLLFKHSLYGDLSLLISEHYDTKFGHKQDVGSYQKIVGDLLKKTLVIEPSEILFLSDVVSELDAAKEAGVRTAEVRRDQKVPSDSHPTVSSFEQLNNIFSQLVN